MDWDGNPVLWKGVPCHQTPDDLWNYQEFVWEARPPVIVEVGPGEGGTAKFLADLGVCPVLSVGEGDPAPEVEGAFVILDGDVYSREAMLKDLETYAPMARWLAVCHTVRAEWGSYGAFYVWHQRRPEWERFYPRLSSRHTWLRRVS